MLFSGSPALRETRNHRTSIGAPRSSTSSPACARTVEWRPSAPITRSGDLDLLVRARTPATRPPSLEQAGDGGLHAQLNRG